jgi:hypothetical protein
MTPDDTSRFRATSGDQQGFGATPFEALQALMDSAPGDPSGPIVIWPYNRGDQFFCESQLARLRELRARIPSLTADERAELEQLVASSFDAAAKRTRSMAVVKR